MYNYFRRSCLSAAILMLLPGTFYLQYGYCNTIALSRDTADFSVFRDSTASDSASSVLQTDAALKDSALQIEDSDSSKTVQKAESPVNDNNVIISGKLDKVIVRGETSGRLINSNQSISIIKPSEWVGTGKTVADVIGEQPGIQTRKYGGTGSFQTVSIRGVEGKDVLVLLDGVPLNSAEGGAVDLGVFDPAMLDEIEVYKGFVPAEFGGNMLGGAINLKSKQTLKSDHVGLHASLEAYGNQRYVLETSHFFTDNIRIFGALAYRQADNDWPYLDRNKTPYNSADDRVEKVENHGYRNTEIRLYPSIYLKNSRVITTGVTWLQSEIGVPGLEGSVNRTAKNDHSMLLITSSIQKENRATVTRGISFVPQIGYTRISDGLFWTSLDSSMGTSHGTIYSVPNSYGRTNERLHVVNAAVNAETVFSDNINAHVSVSGKYSSITTSSESSGFGHGANWPGNSEEAAVAADLNAAFPAGIFTPGVVLSSSFHGLRSETEGGRNDVLSKTIPQSHRMDYPWSIHGGVNCLCGDYVKIFANAARYMSVPSLQERYGFNGTVEPNPDLKAERGTNTELGVRLVSKKLTAECAAFRSAIKNGIIIESDGTISKPVNIAESETMGVEGAIKLDMWNVVQISANATWQNAQNHSHWYNNYGNRLPGEPDLSAMWKIEAGPFLHFTISYWADFRSAFYRDQANKMRIPADTSRYGTLYHNVKLSWKMAKKLSVSASFCNINTKAFKYEEIVSGQDESGYSWIVYPQNQWNISADILF